MFKKCTGRLMLALFLVGTCALAAPVGKNRAMKAYNGWIRSGATQMGMDLSQKNITESYTQTNAAGRALYHVFDLMGGGYVVISAEDRVEPILAFSSDGAFSADPQSPLYLMLLADLSDRFEQCDEADQASSVETAQENSTSRKQQQKRFNKKAARWDRLVEDASVEYAVEEAGSESSIDDVRVDVLVSTRWNQSSPENLYTPNSYPCGCVATAMCQLMRYHSHPVDGIGLRSKNITVDDVSQSATTRGGDGSGGAYSWGDMPNWPNSSHDQVGALCYDAGVSVAMSYASDGSGTDTQNAAQAFMSWFDYASAKKHYTGTTVTDEMLHNAVNANLDASCPVLFGITGNGGHAVVCDGYGYNDDIPYHHINMGWAGSSDAWYNLPEVGSFDRVYKLVYNVFPSEGGAIISGRVFGADGFSMSGVTVEADNGSQTYTATTNTKGIYAIQHVPEGSYTVAVADSDLTSDEMNVSISDTTIIDSCPNEWGVNLTVSDSIFTAVADSYVQASASSSNYGTEEILATRSAADGNATETFIKFDLSTVTDSIDCAELRVVVESNSDDGMDELFLVASDSWTETGINYGNKPSVDTKIADITPTIIPTSLQTTTLIGGSLNNGNLDDDSVVTDSSSGDTWSTKVADAKYYIAANPSGSGYYTGWTLSRLGSYPGGNDTIGMLTYAHPTAFDSGLSPDFCAFANSGGVQIESDPVSGSIGGGGTVEAVFEVSTMTDPSTFSAETTFIFDKDLTSETTVTATPSATVALALVTYNGSTTAYAGTYSASCSVPDDFSSVAVRVGVQNSTDSVGVSIDDVELSYITTGVTLDDRMMRIDVSDVVKSELSGDGIITFCLRGADGPVTYGSRESEHMPKLIISQSTDTDSALAWEADGTQPDGQWTYGCYPQYGPYTSFTQYPNWTTYYAGSQSWIGGEGKIWDHAEGYPRVGKYASSPYGTSGSHTIDTTAKLESVKRWTSNIKGVVSIVNDVQQIQNSGDGNIVRIRKNGLVVWTHELEAEYRTVHTLELSVYPGDIIDFAVDPIGSHSSDWIYWRSRITTLPATANRSQLAAYYDFDEASDMPTDADGDQYDRKMYAFDYSGEGRHAPLANTDTWTIWKAGYLGNAIDFDGTDDVVQTPVVVNPASGAISAAAWVKGGAANQALIGQTGGQDWLKLDASGKLASMVSPAGTALAAPDAWDASAWHHVALVYDGALRRLYIDGKEVASEAIATPAASSGALTIGAGAAGNFDGLVDDLGIWTRGLSANEVYSIYNSGLAGRNLAHVKGFFTNDVTVDLSNDLYNYDLGPTDGPVQTDWTALTPNMTGDIYWEETVSATDRGQTSGVNNINRDFIHSSSDATLHVRVADGTWHATINAGDTDQAHDDISFTCLDGGDSGTASPAASAFPYVHLDGFVEDGYFTLHFSDLGGADPEWVITRLSLSNQDNDHRPTAADASTDVMGGESVGVTLNGSDADGDTLTYTVLTQPDHGSLSGSGSNLTYTADLIYSGSDSFTYKVADAYVDSATATVTITVASNTDYDNDGLPNDWEDQYFSNSTNALPTANPDGDALENLAEYAFGGNPTNAADMGTLPRIEEGIASMDCVFVLRDDPELTATVLTCPDCASGSWSTNGVQAGANGAGFTSFTNSLPDEDCLFIKLRIEN